MRASQVGSYMMAGLAGVGVGLGLAAAGWVYTHPIEAGIGARRWQLGRIGHKVRRGRFTFFTGGQGPTVVLVHGFGDQAGSWATTANALANGFRVIVPDLPGHGESAPMSAPNTIESQLHGLEQIIDHATMPDEPLILVGNSMGGWLSMEYALRHPDRVRKLVLVNSAGLSIGEEHDLHRDHLLPGSRDDMLAKVDVLLGEHMPAVVPGFILDALMADQGPFLYELFENLAVADHLDDRLKDLQAPTTLIWGAQDAWFPLDYAERLHRAIPQSSLHIVRNWTHAPQLSHPDAFTSKLVEILLTARY